MTNQQKRLEKVRAAMEALGFDGLFLQPSTDFAYVTGLPRPNPQPTTPRHHGGWLEGALITGTRCFVFTHRLRLPFMREMAGRMPWIDDVAAIVDGEDIHALARRYFQGLSTVGFSPDGHAGAVLEVQGALPELRIRSSDAVMAPLRAIKDDEEMEKMRRAAALTDEIFAALRRRLRLGMTHHDVLEELHHQIRAAGADGVSFHPEATVRGPGAPAGLPGSEPGPVALAPGRVLAFDLGIVLDGYCSDFGRTVFCGEPNDEYAAIYKLVRQAHEAAVEALQPGAAAGDVDELARSIIAGGGFGDAFIHRLGHGIGMDVHEKPFLMKGDDTPLQEGMCFAVEPSVFLLDRGWFRVEDVVVVGEGGGECLTRASRDLDVLE